MRLDSLVRLIEAADFMSFREIALECLTLKGYREVALTDGGKDGGTDLRVFESPPNPAKIAFQITVQKDWISKLHSDAAKCRQRLNLEYMTLVCSRRIPEHEFDAQREEIWRNLAVNVNRIDSQAIATTFYSNGRTARILEILGIRSDAKPEQDKSSPRAVAALAFSFFGEDAQQFREMAIDSTIISALSEGLSLDRGNLTAIVANILNLEHSQTRLIDASVDRLLQKKDLIGPSSALHLSDKLAAGAKTLRALRVVEEEALRSTIGEVLGRYVKQFSEEHVDAVVADLGALMVESARDAVASVVAISSESGLLKNIRAQLQHLHTTLDALGVAEGHQRVQLLAELAQGAADSPMGKHLFSGELFLSMLSARTPQLINAFGARTGIQVLLDASVAIPMLCSLLYQVVQNKFAISAKHAYDQLSLHKQKMLLPTDYLEEVATHLLNAFSDYMHIVDLDPDLASSENSFIAHYVILRQGGVDVNFLEFMSSFGLDESLRKAEFYVARDRLKPRLQRLFDKYGIHVSPLGHPSHESVKRAEEGIAYAVKAFGKPRPKILQRHDARTIAYLHDRDRSADEADILCTWDTVQFWMHEHENVDWLVMNPAVLGDVFAVARANDYDGRIRTPVVVARTLSDEVAEAGAAVIDVIVKLERGKSHDAKLMAEAKRFKDDLMIRSRGKGAAQASIADEWARWKATYCSDDGVHRDNDKSS